MTETENIQKISIAEPIQLNINIPDIGNIGKDGKDGTNGIDGKDGRDGDSAYKIAVKNGFVGTEKEWLASLKGGGSNESTNITLRNLIADDISNQNKETFVDLLTKGVQLKRMYRNTASSEIYDGGVVWDIGDGDYGNDPASTFLLLREVPQYLTVKRASDNKTFLVPISSNDINDNSWRTYKVISLEDKSVIHLTATKCTTHYKDDEGIEQTGEGYGFKSRTDGYEVLDGVVKASCWTPFYLSDFSKEFVCENSNVGMLICALKGGNIPETAALTELVITYKTQDGMKLNRTVYDFELQDESVVIELAVAGVKLEFRDFGSSLYLHSVRSNTAIITGVYYK